MLFLSEAMPEEMKVNLPLHPVRFLAPFAELSLPVASHPDMLLFPTGNELIVPKRYYEDNPSLFDGISLAVTDEIFRGGYPNEVRLNALRVRETVFGHEKALSPLIRDRFRIVNVKQGYARCSVCMVDEDHFITADPSLFKALREKRKDVLSVSPGFINLPGYETGFIGGASFSFANAIYFFGDLFRHPDGKRMADYIEKSGKTPICLGKRDLVDLGGAVFVGE